MSRGGDKDVYGTDDNLARAASAGDNDNGSLGRGATQTA